MSRASRLNSRVGQVDAVGAFARAQPSLLQPVATPTGFSWTTHPLAGKTYIDQHGVCSTTFDPTTLKTPGGGTYFVDVVNGNNANDGLTLATALKAPWAAAGKPESIITMKVVGYDYTNPYVRTSGWNGAGVGKYINIIAIDSAGNPNPAAQPIFTTHDVPSWTLMSGMTYTYQTTRSSVSRVVDMINAANGTDGAEYVQVATAALVEATPGSWAQVGSVCYVHTSSNRAADGWIWPLLSVINFRNTGDFTTYAENCKFYGGSECIRSAGSTAAGGKLVLSNVEVRYSQTNVGNNIAVNGSDAVLFGVDTSFSGMDGTGYHAQNGKIPLVVEAYCRGFNDGHVGQDQCTTAHDGTKIIRVECKYRSSAGAVLADVNDGTESWILGGVYDNGAAGYSMKFGNDAGTVKAFVHAADAKGSKWSIYAYGTAIVKIRGVKFERANVALTAY